MSSFCTCRSQKRRKILRLDWIFMLLGAMCVKAAHKYVGEIGPGQRGPVSSQSSWSSWSAPSTWCQFHPHITSRFFWIKVFYKDFMCLRFGLVTFWRKEIGPETAHKMPVKLTTGVNFLNILWVAFLYKSLTYTYLYLEFVFVFLGERKLAKKLLIKCWWKWL